MWFILNCLESFIIKKGLGYLLLVLNLNTKPIVHLIRLSLICYLNTGIIR